MEISTLIKQSFYQENGVLYWNKKSGSKVKKHMRAGTLNKGYLRVLFSGNRFYNHQIIFFLENGYITKNIDHKDRDKLNNKPNNLRESTPTQNCANRGKRSNNTSGFKGVSLHKLTNKFQAEIEVSGKRIYLGLFESAELAAIAYNKEAIDKCGEFANLNVI